MVAMITCHVNCNLRFGWLTVCFGPGYQIIRLKGDIRIIANDCSIAELKSVQYGTYCQQLNMR